MDLNILLTIYRHLALDCCLGITLVGGQLLDLCSLGRCEHLLLVLERGQIRGAHLRIHILLLLGVGRCREEGWLVIRKCCWLVEVSG